MHQKQKTYRETHENLRELSKKLLITNEAYCHEKGIADHPTQSNAN